MWGRLLYQPSPQERPSVMDDPVLHELREINPNLQYVTGILLIVAIGAFLAGRGAVLEHGFWAIMGF